MLQHEICHEIQVKCDTCDAKFTQKSKLNTHVAAVQEMKPYVIYVMLNLQQNKI